MIKKLGINKNNFLLLLVSLSIFFSYTDFNTIKIINYLFNLQTCTFNLKHCNDYLNFFNFPLRFSLFLAFPILIYDKIYLNKKLIIFSLGFLLLCFLFSLISFYNIKISTFNNLQDLFVQIFHSYLFDKKKIIEYGVIFYTIIFIYQYLDLIRNNIFKIINIFLILFFISSCFYFVNNPDALLFLKGCTSGFFRITNFIYLENSHLHLIGIPILCYSLLNIKRYFKNLYILFPLIYFVLIIIVSTTTTYYIGAILSSTYLLLINNKKISLSSLILIVFLIINIIFLLNTKTCRSQEVAFSKKQADNPVGVLSENISTPFVGSISSPFAKLFNQGLFQIFKSTDYSALDIINTSILDGYDGTNAFYNYQGQVLEKFIDDKEKGTFTSTLYVKVRLLNKKDIEKRKLPNQTTGMVVTSTAIYNRADKSVPHNYLDAGNIITEVQNKKIKSLIGLEDAVRKALKSDQEIISIVVYNNQNQKKIMKIRKVGGRMGLSFSVAIYSFTNATISFMKYPFGVGLNNYQINHAFSYKNYLKNPDIYYAPLYDKISLNILNFNDKDGGANYPKILSEFGIIAIIIFITLIYLSFSTKMSFKEKSFFLTLLLIQILVRGTGYFNNGFLIILIIVLMTLFKKNKYKEL